MRIQMIIFLTGSGAAGGGGTVCWPGVHRTLERIFADDPLRYRSLETLRQERVTKACVGVEPVVVRPCAGDVLFFDLLTPHAVSKVVPPCGPRLAVKHSFAVPFQQQRHLLSGVRNIS
eukprot:COSAG05_NODE_4013_length_1721_cov_8.462088_2_plen_118_part_01